MQVVKCCYFVGTQYKFIQLTCKAYLEWALVPRNQHEMYQTWLIIKLHVNSLNMLQKHNNLTIWAWVMEKKTKKRTLLCIIYRTTKGAETFGSVQCHDYYHINVDLFWSLNVQMISKVVGPFHGIGSQNSQRAGAESGLNEDKTKETIVSFWRSWDKHKSLSISDRPGEKVNGI